MLNKRIIDVLGSVLVLSFAAGYKCYELNYKAKLPYKFNNAEVKRHVKDFININISNGGVLSHLNIPSVLLDTTEDSDITSTMSEYPKIEYIGDCAFIGGRGRKKQTLVLHLISLSKMFRTERSFYNELYGLIVRAAYQNTYTRRFTEDELKALINSTLKKCRMYK